MRAYLAAIDSRYPQLLERAEDPSRPITLTSLTDSVEKQLSQQLYYVLTLLITEGRATDKAILAGAGEGLVLWRMVLLEYEPPFQSRMAAMFQKVVSYQLDASDLLSSIDKFDGACQEYAHASHRVMEEDTKSGIILRSLHSLGVNGNERCAKLAEHLMLEAATFNTYDAMKQEIRRVIMVQQDLATSGQAVGAIAKGRGKSKGGKPGRIPLTVKFDGECHYCGRGGHKQADCWDKAEGRPRGLGKRKGSPKGDKGGGRGAAGAAGEAGAGKNASAAGASNARKRCKYCGLFGHSEEECRKKAADSKEASSSAAEPGAKRKRINALEEAAAQLVEAVRSFKSDEEVGALALNAIELAAEIGAVRRGEVRIGIDSGAEISVWPLDLFPGVVLQSLASSRAGTMHWSPDKAAPSIKELGKEINSLDDFKGLKFRMPGIGGEVLRELGVAVINLPGAEVFPALQAGTIDGTEWVGPWFDMMLGFYKVAKYYYHPGFHEPGTAGSFAINKGLWDSLTKDEQLIIEVAIQAEAMIQGAEFNARNLASLDVLTKKHGVKLRQYSNEMLTKIGTIAGQVVADIGNTDATSKKVYESYIAYRKQSLAWAKLSEQGYMNARMLPFKYA